MTFVNNIKHAFASDTDRKQDSGDLVQFLVITALIAVAAITVMIVLSKAMINRGAQTADCIEGANLNNSQETSEKCKGVPTANGGGSYQDRYGSK